MWTAGGWRIRSVEGQSIWLSQQRSVSEINWKDVCVYGLLFWRNYKTKGVRDSQSLCERVCVTHFPDYSCKQLNHANHRTVLMCPFICENLTHKCFVSFVVWMCVCACVCVLTVGVLALASSGSPAMLLRLEELLYGLWLLGEEAVRWDTKDTDGSQTDTRTDGLKKPQEQR